MTFFGAFHGEAFYEIFNPEGELYGEHPTQATPALLKAISRKGPKP
jgi:hypothetical protein